MLIFDHNMQKEWRYEVKYLLEKSFFVVSSISTLVDCRCYDCRGSPGPTTFGRVHMCPAGNSRAKTDRVRVSNGRPAKGIH